MKPSIIVAAAAIALGCAAFAADNNDGETSRERAQAQRSEHVEKDKGESLGQKLKRGMHNLGEKTRHAFHRKDADHDRTAARHDDTRAMGAGPDRRASETDRARRARMDDAYSNWQRRHPDADKR